MGLSNFPGTSEGVLPVLVMNTVLSVALLKSMVRSVFQVMSGANVAASTQNLEEDGPDGCNTRERRVSVARYKSMCHKRSKRGGGSRLAMMVECCVCLCGFEEEQEVSELSCKHFFHKGCLEKWFDNDHTTCPLCRSVC
ncbi:PREDICTED: probable E3 ubiquitin-protein ligase XERICO [Fragaria vesca subsp. vesca]|uniref:probable E3 ubiquitin-protein ligase XERICO n=1 Tax=Fragaria vesca subsp. vesca TaxID=101020 RepID=UPI0002C31C65|nr:PREDICTED: probable E3 ubiquitin-protein ligase XERICO [Fragaria vesca subsp. vesca]